MPALQALPGLQLASPKGGMYAFFRLDGCTDAMALAKSLVDAGKSYNTTSVAQSLLTARVLQSLGEVGSAVLDDTPRLAAAYAEAVAP